MPPPSTPPPPLPLLGSPSPPASPPPPPRELGRLDFTMGIQQGSWARHRQRREALAGEAGRMGGGRRGQAAARAARPDGRRCEDRPAERAGPAGEGQGGGQRRGPGRAAGLPAASLKGERVGRGIEGCNEAFTTDIGSQFCSIHYYRLLHDYCIITHPLLQNYCNITANCVKCNTITVHYYQSLLLITH